MCAHEDSLCTRVSIVWCINQLPYDTLEYLRLYSSQREGWWLLHAFSTFRYLSCQRAPLPRLSAAKGTRAAKLPPPPPTHPKSFRPSANLATSLWGWASEKQRKPAWASAGSYITPASSFLLLLPPICAYTHIRISVLMRACYCLYLLCSLTSISALRWITWVVKDHSSFWLEVWFNFIVIALTDDFLVLVVNE